MREFPDADPTICSGLAMPLGRITRLDIACAKPRRALAATMTMPIRNIRRPRIDLLQAEASPLESRYYASAAYHSTPFQRKRNKNARAESRGRGFVFWGGGYVGGPLASGASAGLETATAIVGSKPPIGGLKNPSASEGFPSRTSRRLRHGSKSRIL